MNLLYRTSCPTLSHDYCARLSRPLTHPLLSPLRSACPQPVATCTAAADRASPPHPRLSCSPR